MKVRKAIKKIAALGAGITMVGATILGAMAADLSAYPAPFVQNGQFNALIIVALIPLALRGVPYRPIGAAKLL